MGGSPVNEGLAEEFTQAVCCAERKGVGREALGLLRILIICIIANCHHRHPLAKLQACSACRGQVLCWKTTIANW